MLVKTTSKQANLRAIIFYILCLLAASDACFTPFQLPTPRSGAGIAALNNKIYFAGGVETTGETSRALDVFDTTTNTWSRHWLATPRQRIRCSAVGHHVIFAFGVPSMTSEVHPYADIFDTLTQTMTASINLPSLGLQNVLVFGQYVVYHYSNQFVFLDPSSGTIQTRNVVLTASVSNGTHLFGFLMRNNLIQIFPLDSDTLSFNAEPAYNVSMRISFFGLPTLYLVDGRLVIRDVDGLNVYSFQPEPPERVITQISIPSAASTIVYGPTLHFIGSNSIVSYNKGGVIMYSVQRELSTDRPAIIAHNGVIYMSDPSPEITTIVLDGLVQYTPTPGGFQFQRRDFGFFLSGALDAYWFNLHTQQIRQQSFDNVISSTYVELDDYWVFNTGHLFHFPSETWTVTEVPFPVVLSGGILTTSMQGSIAVFNYVDQRQFQIFNATDLSWRQQPGSGSTALASEMAGVRNKIILTSYLGEIEVIDIVTNNRTLISPQIRGPFVTTEDLFIMAAAYNVSGWPTQLTDIIVIYNAVTDTFQFDRLSVPGPPRHIVQSKTHVFFVTSTSTIDIYNIAESTWSHVEIPVHFANNGLEAVAGLSYLVIRRPQRVDMYNVLTNEWRVLAEAPIDSPFTAMQSSGSKVLFTIANGLVIFELTTGDWQRIDASLARMQITDSFVVWITQFFVTYRPLSTMTNTLKSQSIYETQSIGLDTGLTGPKNHLRIDWRHNGVSLNSSGSSLTLHNVMQPDAGEYIIRAIDQCYQSMAQSARISVVPRPTFIQPLEDSINLCHKSVLIQAQVKGEESLEWTINGAVQTTNTANITIQPDTLACNVRHQLCLTATNPSGTNQTCGNLRLLEHDMLFDGPRPTVTHRTWFMESQATLQVKLLDNDCTRHWWLIDGIAQEPIDSRQSSLSVNISALSTFTRYAISAQCGSSVVTSNPFTFDNVSSLTVGHLVLIVVLVFVVVLAAVVAVALFRRRIKAGEKHEMELQNLLTQAKSESLNRDGVSVIPSTTWEWKPTEDFTYKALDRLPCSIDSSMLSQNSKDSTVKVDTWNQAEVVFSLKSKNNSKSDNTLKERLIDGLHVDIYAPESPKYEVRVEPSSFTLKQGKATHVTVSTLMRMTTKCKICLVIVIEQQHVYAILEYKMASAMSTWIDLEEVEMTGDFLGGGGFGTVTRGVYRGGEVAVKKILNQCMIEELKQEFEREITLMKDLHHPNIVQFVGASNVKDNLAILIEYAPLGSLSSVMQKTKLSYMMKLTILLESAKALQFLHLNRVIHRDIKPQNILVFSLEPKASVHVKLTDFGTSRFISDNTMTVTKNVGTMNYMAPEALGKNPRIDKSADIYSFALLIWELMYEQQPFTQFEWQSDLEMHVKNGGRMPLERNVGVSDDLIKLIEDCWHQDPAARPSASEVVQRISNLM